MPNEMIRPCTLWGETFDAMDVRSVYDYLTFKEESDMPSKGYNCAVLIRDPFKGDIASPTYKNKRESYKAIIEAITTIAEALNPPIKVTQAVLEAIEKVPEAFFWYVEGSVNVRLKWDMTLKTFTVNGQTLSITDYIQADCSLALDVLLDFDIEGEKYA